MFPAVPRTAGGSEPQPREFPVAESRQQRPQPHPQNSPLPQRPGPPATDLL